MADDAPSSSPLVNYLIQQPRGRLRRLYENPWTCEAVLRALPPLARQYALRLALLDGQPVPVHAVERWASDSDAHAAAQRWLLDLAILVEVGEEEPSTRALCLDTEFSKQLAGLMRGVQPQQPKPPDKHTPSADALRRHATERWDELLLCIVRTDLWYARYEATPPPFNLPEQLLYPAQLLEVRYLTPDSDDEADGDDATRGEPYWAMSRLGAQFVLQELSAQVWHILQVYIGDDERKLAFMLELSHKRCGQGYSVEEAHRPLLCELHNLGIVHVRNPTKSKSFYPTHLASAIISSAALADAAREYGQTIVESNFRVYCYTTSAALREVLALFLRLRCVLPDVIVASISREQVQLAIKEHGLRAADIIGFLARGAHPEVRARPADERDKAQTVFDQVRLWERELERYTCHDAYYLSQFDSHELFDDQLEYARASGVLLWHHRDSADPRACKLVLRGSEQVVNEARLRIKDFKKRAGAAARPVVM